MSNLAYTIITIDESRAEKKANIRNAMSGMDEIFIPWVDARSDEAFEFHKELNKDIELKWKTILSGEYGIFLSKIRAWRWASEMNYDGLILFEDDAVLSAGAKGKMENLVDLLPYDWDLFSIWISPQQYEECLEEYITDHREMARAYQEYGAVVEIVSRQGAEKMVQLVYANGIDAPVDCSLFDWAKAGKLNAYSLTPEYANIASISWSADSTIRGRAVWGEPQDLIIDDVLGFDVYNEKEKEWWH